MMPQCPGRRTASCESRPRHGTAMGVSGDATRQQRNREDQVHSECSKGRRTVTDDVLLRFRGGGPPLKTSKPCSVAASAIALGRVKSQFSTHLLASHAQGLVPCIIGSALYVTRIVSEVCHELPFVSI